MLTITRSGIYGSIMVDWTTGQLAASLPPGVTNGQITPATGSVSLGHGEESKNFTVQVRKTKVQNNIYYDTVTLCAGKENKGSK